MKPDYDQIIKNIINEWRSIPQKFDFQTRSLERHVIPILYYNIRKEILKEKLAVNKKKFQKRFNQLKKSGIHVFWILIWSIKWILKPLPNKKFIVCAVGSDRKLTFAYLQNLIEYANERNLVIISLNVICNKEIFIRSEIFYYPRFLYQARYYRLIKEFGEDLSRMLAELEKITASHIPLSVNFNAVNRFINDYSRDYYCVKKYFERKKNNIALLVQDFDYTSNRNIYCEIFRKFNIPTVSLNHSILLYNHLYESVYSDYALVWGQNQKQRIATLSERQPKLVSVIGSPIKFKETKRTDEKKTYWIYYLPSFENPAAETIHRSVHRTLQMIEKINQLILNDRLQIKLLQIFHPNDSISSLKKAGFNNLYFSSQEIIHKTELVFCEDSTIAVEMMNTEIPLIYISDEINNDPFDFRKWKTTEIAQLNDDLKRAVQISISKMTDIQNRKKHIEFFFGESRNFYNNLKKEIDYIIHTEKQV